MIRGITCGAFDLLHAGHVVMFEEAKEICDYLLVAIQTDPSTDRPNKHKPVQSIVERQLQVKAVKWVDDTIVYHTEKELEDIFNTLPIDVRIIGEEYKEELFTGRDICKQRGIDVYYNKRKHNFSTTKLRKQL
jgi:glycerol-3-phosphate cytidylyltransferase